MGDRNLCAARARHCRLSESCRPTVETGRLARLSAATCIYGLGSCSLVGPDFIVCKRSRKNISTRHVLLKPGLGTRYTVTFRMNRDSCPIGGSCGCPDFMRFDFRDPFMRIPRVNIIVQCRMFNLPDRFYQIHVRTFKSVSDILFRYAMTARRHPVRHPINGKPVIPETDIMQFNTVARFSGFIHQFQT